MISSFHGEHRFLSNFWPCPVELPWLDGIIFPTAEHAFQACKSEELGDVMLVLAAPTPGEAKRTGRRITIRPDWDQIRKRIMMEVLLAKFGGSTELAAALVATGDHHLVEGNNWGDKFWGALLVTSDRHMPINPQVGVNLWVPAAGSMLAGENWLGRLLMMTRDIVRS